MYEITLKKVKLKFKVRKLNNGIFLYKQNAANYILSNTKNSPKFHPAPFDRFNENRLPPKALFSKQEIKYKIKNSTKIIFRAVLRSAVLSEALRLTAAILGERGTQGGRCNFVTD